MSKPRSMQTSLHISTCKSIYFSFTNFQMRLWKAHNIGFRKNGLFTIQNEWKTKLHSLNVHSKSLFFFSYGSAIVDFRIHAPCSMNKFYNVHKCFEFSSSLAFSPFRLFIEHKKYTIYGENSLTNVHLFIVNSTKWTSVQ